MNDDAVITGIGVVCATGTDRDTWWEAATNGVRGIDRIRRFDPSAYATTLAGEVHGFDPATLVDNRLVVQTDIWTQFALAATDQAIEDAGLTLPVTDPHSVAVITASSSGGNLFGQREIERLWSTGPRAVSTYQSIAWFYAATTGQISIHHGFKGMCGVLSSEGAGGIDAFGQARRAIRSGSAAVISGGTEAPIGPYALTCQLTKGGLSSSSDPARAYLPFDAAASGHVPGEGGAIVVVEPAAVADARGTPGYAAIAGYGATHDGAGPVSGNGLARAARVALTDARISAADVDVVFADGSGDPGADRREVESLQAVFGDRLGTVPVTVPASNVGRLYAGGASLDLATAALALRHGVIPPTATGDGLAPDCRIDLVVGSARETPVRHALVLARGHGGFNAAMVLRRAA